MRHLSIEVEKPLIEFMKLFDRSNPELIQELKKLYKTGLNLKKEAICKKYVKSAIYDEIVPIYVLPEENFWSTRFNYSMIDYYKNPSLFMKTQLIIKIVSFKSFRDFTVLTDDISIYLGTGFSFIILGMEPLFTSNQPLYVDTRKPLIKKESDINKLEIPDFYKSNIMPYVFNLYETLIAASKKELNISFPTWLAGPWSMAWHIRGGNNLLLDTHMNLQLAHKILNYVTDARIRWEHERIKRFGNLGSSAFSTPYLPNGNECILGCDEIDGTIISPNFYQKNIFPYEELLAERSDRTYYHSCGNITNILEMVNNLPNLYKVEICRTGKTDLKKAVKVLDEEVILQICMNPIKDIFQSNKKKMKNTLRHIISESKGRKIEIILEGINSYPLLNTDDQIKKIKQWIYTAYEVTDQKDLF